MSPLRAPRSRGRGGPTLPRVAAALLFGSGVVGASSPAWAYSSSPPPAAGSQGTLPARGVSHEASPQPGTFGFTSGSRLPVTRADAEEVGAVVALVVVVGAARRLRRRGDR